MKNQRIKIVSLTDENVQILLESTKAIPALSEAIEKLGFKMVIEECDEDEI